MAVSREDLVRAQSGWQAPPELAAPGPRRAVLTRPGRANALLSRLLYAAAAALCLYAGYQASRQYVLHLRGAAGHTTTATIVRKWKTGNKPRDCNLRYTYQAGGAILSVEQRFYSSACAKVKEGDRVPVLYDERDSGFSRLPALEEPWWAELTLLFPAAVAAFIAWAAGYPARQQRRLLESGRPAAARVTAVRNFKRRWYVHYSFLDMSGNPANGSSSTSEQRASATSTGEVVTVLYDAGRPARNALYPCQLAELSGSPS